MIVAYIDGSCEPANPGGTMGIGVWINDGEIAYCEKFKPKQSNTNNMAEYLALNKLLEICKDKHGETIVVNSDSLLLVNQMNGLNRINRGAYKELALACRRLLYVLRTTNNVVINWIPREQNTLADGLSKSLN